MFEVVDDRGAGPVLGGDELAAEVALAVDDVGLGYEFGAVEGGDLLAGVADGEEIDVVEVEEVLVGGGVLVPADGYYGEVGHLALEGEEAGQLFDAGGAVGGPEVEDYDAATELAEVDGAGGIADDELRGGAVNVFGMAATVAAGAEQDCKCYNCGYELRCSTHDGLQFL